MKFLVASLTLFLFCGFTIAQNPDFDKKVKKLDSLIFYSNYSEADKYAENLSNLLGAHHNEKKYEEWRIQILLRKAEIHYRIGQYSKASKVALDAIDRSKKYNLSETEYEANLIAAVTYEQASHFELCKNHMDEAYALYRQKKLDSQFSTYCVRISSYYRLTQKKDSAIYFAYKGMDYAKKYANTKDLTDTYLLLTMLLAEDEPKKSVAFGSMAVENFLKRNDFDAAASMYHNIASTYMRNNEFNTAFLYNNLAFDIQKKHKLNDDTYSLLLRIRYQLFESTGNKDSAFYYLKKYHSIYLNAVTQRESTDIKKITEQYENDKKEATIKSKNQQMILIGGLLGVIAIATILLIRKNRKINLQNKVISKQLIDLSRTLEQKQVLLSELQHRVKNNLQHVISILEIQKESVDFNNIDELIRGNQNRIHSMALLHKKLNVSDNVNDVDLKRYITELSELVKESYDSHKKKISLKIECEIETISIEKALPLGLIIVELVSNSMKHAFKKQPIGIISIAITNHENANQLNYFDNGIGFDFTKTTKKGLGQEIIKGLIDQLDGEIKTQSHNGFELSIFFK